MFQLTLSSSSNIVLRAANNRSTVERHLHTTTVIATIHLKKSWMWKLLPIYMYNINLKNKIGGFVKTCFIVCIHSFFAIWVLVSLRFILLKLWCWWSFDSIWIAQNKLANLISFDKNNVAFFIACLPSLLSMDCCIPSNVYHLYITFLHLHNRYYMYKYSMLCQCWTKHVHVEN